MNLIIIDDDKLVCTALKTILESNSNVKVQAIGHSGTDAIKLYENFNPDILLMDIRMNGMTGIESGKIILENHKDAKILYLTTFADNEYIIAALNIGAKGYILKQNFESILPAINSVILGQSVFGDEIATKLPSIMKKEKSFSGFNLSEKEIQIIKLVADGLSNKEIANIIFLSEGTVRNYISIILEKLELRDRTQLAIFYYKNI